jgi:Tol biopolymer transport system component
MARNAMPAQTIAHYRIQVKIGAGGMGEVYRATDTRLGRDVAVKVLPELFVRDAERMARFEREAKVLASLNHPNIASIYGLEESNGIRALVMELVEGPTLADRIQQGPIPLDETLPIAKQISEALEYAHERAVIHRDLKPANVKLTPEGQVKVLDFGLAKVLEGDSGKEELQNSPTLSAAMTRAGVLLGTAAYMAPEQARGKPVDRRADNWAFGCVVYEMLTGRCAFTGETTSDTLAAVIHAEPAWTALPARTPRPIRGLLRACLQKDPKQRLQAIGDARIAIEEVLSGSAPTEAAPATWRRLLPWALASLLLITTFVALWNPWRAAPATREVARFTIALRPNEQLFETGGGLAISPDGAYIAYTSTLTHGGMRQLFLRPLDRNDAVVIAGTDGATGPFFSPDGQWIAFTADGKLKKVSLAGGAPISLCERPSGNSGTWGPDGTIFFPEAGPFGKLLRVPASGGKPEAVTTAETKPGELSVRWPEVLPGGRAILYAAGGTIGAFGDDATLFAQSLETGRRQTLVQGGTFPRYVSTGHLVYAQGGRLLALPFDVRSLEVTGSAAPVVEDVWQGTGGYSAYTISRDGSLVYVNGGEAAGASRRSLNWVDRTGAVHPTGQSPHAFNFPSLSADGRRVAVVNRDMAPRDDIWTGDLVQGTLMPLTFVKPGQRANNPIWTPDGKHVIYSLYSGNQSKIMRRPADGSGQEELLFSSNDQLLIPSSCSPDGQLLVFVKKPPDRLGWDLGLLSLTREHTARPLIESSLTKVQAQISPDGRWLAYTSNLSNRNEVYVQPFPGLGAQWQISTTGGSAPRWSRDARQLFYLNGDKMMVADIQTKPVFSTGTPRMLFESYSSFVTAGAVVTNYDVAPDGQRFLMLKEEEAQASQLQLHVVLNWSEELKRRLAPAGKQP